MNKLSALVASQLPRFISNNKDYSEFVSFLEHYYEWLEQEKNVLFHSENILDYLDIDKTLPEFLDYFYNQFMPSFPKDVVADKRKLLKLAKEFYQSKGTKDSYNFLFKALYDSDCEIIENQDYVFSASAGKWFSPKAIKIRSLDERFSLCENLFMLGEQSKTLARITSVKVVQDKIEIFISDIQRLFKIGEYVRIVDFKGNPYYFDVDGNIMEDVYLPSTGELITPKESRGEILRSKIISAISSISVNKKFRGNYYNAGNPVVFYGGLTENGKGAEAYISDVNVGFIQKVAVDQNSCVYGYRNPYTAIHVNPDINKKTIIEVDEVYEDESIVLDNIIIDSLQLKEFVVLNCDPATGLNTKLNHNYGFKSDQIINANTRMDMAFTFNSITTNKLKSLTVVNGGGGFYNPPVLDAKSMYATNLYISRTSDSYDPRYDFDLNLGITYGHEYASLYDLGILAPIKILSGGVGYRVGWELKFSGIGIGAFAKITEISATGAITAVEYYTKETVALPLGGVGYSDKPLPTISVVLGVDYNRLKTGNTVKDTKQIALVSPSNVSELYPGMLVTGAGIDSDTLIVSLSGNNVNISKNTISTLTNTELYFRPHGANLVVSGIMGGSANLIPTTDRIGSVNSFNIINYGEDYEATPNVSLKIEDFVIYNVGMNEVPVKGDKFYNNSYAYYSWIDSVTLISDSTLLNQRKYLIRTYNNNKKVDITKKLFIQRNSSVFSYDIDSEYIFPVEYNGIPEQKTGVVRYGDGGAKANAKFLNGLILGNGRYLDESGQPSSYNVLQSENFNSFTYVLSVQKEINKYRDIVYELLHPAGTKLLGQCRIDSYPRKDPVFTVQYYYDGPIDEYESIHACIAAEYEKALDIGRDGAAILFNESIARYCTINTENPAYNKILKITNFPTDIVVGMKVSGVGVLDDSLITEIDLINNRIKLNSTTLNDWETALIKFKNDDTGLIMSANVSITNGTNYITLKDGFIANPMEGIEKNYYVSMDPIILLGNTTVGVAQIQNPVDISKVVSGQMLVHERFASGSVVEKDELLNVVNVYRGANYPSVRTPVLADATSVYYIEYYDVKQHELIRANIHSAKLYGFPDTTIINSIDTNAKTVQLNYSCVSESSSKIYYFMKTNTLEQVDTSSNEIILLVESGNLEI